MKVLITGSAGLIGQKIIAELESRPDIQIIATSRQLRKPVFISRKIEYHPADLTNHRQVEIVFDSCRPDVIINTAAVTQVDVCETNPVDCNKTNIEAVSVLVDLCRKQGTYFIQFSTDFVFDGQSGPYRETDIPNPISRYGQSKLEAEKIVSNSGIHHAIIRTILVYGYSIHLSRKNILIWIINSLKEGKKIKVVSDQIRTPTLAEDVAKGTLQLMEKRSEGLFHMGGIDLLSPFDMALQAADFFGLDSGLIEGVLTADFPQPGKRPLRTGLVIDKIIQTTGYQPHTFREGLDLIKSRYGKYF